MSVAIGEPPPGSTKPNVGFLVHTIALILGWKLRGPTFPHPFFGGLNPLGWLRAAAYDEAHHLKALQASLPR